MKRRVRFIWIVCALLLLTVPFAHGAQKKKKVYEPDLRKWWDRPKIVQKLGLTEQQLSRVKEIYHENRNQIVEERWNYRQQKWQLEDLLTKSDLDQDLIDKQTVEVQTARAALEKTLTETQTAMMKELSPEQRRDLLTILKKWKDPPPRQKKRKDKTRR